MKKPALLFFLSLFLLLLSCKTSKEPSTQMPLVYEQNFQDESVLNDFQFTDPKVWRHHPSGALGCTGRGEYEPIHRSPHAFALISGKQFGSFVLEAKLQQTGRIYDHQDMILVFGFQSPQQFYYTHISRHMDDRANQIMIVNEKPRAKISTKTNDGQNWAEGKWHDVKLVRDIKSGLIQLFFDDMETPVMEATDTTFGEGLIGFGTFDDSGMIDGISIWSDDTKTSKVSHF